LTELEKFLEVNSNWVLGPNQELLQTLNFSNFQSAFAFMTEVALIAEKMDHHPDWSNSYNKVTIGLKTHDKKLVTHLDFDLAKKIDYTYLKFKTQDSAK